MIAWVSLPLRIGLGSIFIAHGLQKVFGLFGGHDIKAFAEMLTGLGFSPPLFWANVAGYTELIGGICILLGIGTTIASAMIFVYMCIATYKVHLAKGFFMSNGGYEYNLLIMVVCIALMMVGGGNLSFTKKL